MENNDLISRSELLERLRVFEESTELAGNVDIAIGYSHSQTITREAKAVDAVPVVRCCNCKYGKFDMVDQGYMEPPDCEGMVCYKHDMLMDFADFCSDGVKRDSEPDVTKAFLLENAKSNNGLRFCPNCGAKMDGDSNSD